MFRKTVCALYLSVALCGCGTMTNLTGSPGESRIYGGVRQDIRHVADGNAIAALDVPLSVVGDTVTLPVTVGRKLVQSR